MRIVSETRSRPQVRAAQSMREECWLFWHGLVESFGVNWTSSKAATDTAGKAASTAPSPHPSQNTASPISAAANSTSSAVSPMLPPPAVEGTETHVRSPLEVDTTACPSPATPSSASTTIDGTATAPVGAASTLLHVQVSLMPPWSLVEYDPKLWMLLRKNLLANLALVGLTAAYVVLAHFLSADASFGGAAATAPSTSATASSLRHGIRSWWLRACLWAVKYMGQWPFYTVLQIIGLVWFSQLYRETWLVRKGWVLRGTRLREATTTKKSLPRKNSAGAASGGVTPASVSASPLPPLTEGVLRPWLAPQPLNRISPRRAFATPTDENCRRPAGWRLFCLVVQASAAYVRHVGELVGRMLRHKGPTAPLQEWVLGDAAAAGAAAAGGVVGGGAGRVSSTSPPPTSPDVFENFVRALESTSEVIFKALATMSFAFFAACVARVPVVGTPLCLLLNAQLYAFYVFDYRYATQQQPDGAALRHSTQGHPHHHLQRGSALTYQLRHFEQCWMYYAGYGAGSAVLSLWLTHRAGVIVSVCAMSVLYSWQVVWSGFAVPLPSSRPLPIFSLWFYAVDMVQRHYAVLWRSATIVALLYIPYQCLRYI